MILLLALAAAAATAPAEYGAPIANDQARAIVEQALKDRLVDPDSAKIEWPYAFSAGTLKARFGHTRYGYWTCGRVNSKNRMGGYSGTVWFMSMVRDGHIQSLDIGTSDGFDAATISCDDAVKEGTLRVAAAAPSPMAQPVPPPPGQRVGFSFVPTPYGALVKIVEPGSPADHAGLKPGMVIAAVNGTPTGAFAAADQIQLVQAPVSHIVYKISGSTDVVIDRPKP